MSKITMGFEKRESALLVTKDGMQYHYYRFANARLDYFFAKLKQERTEIDVVNLESNDKDRIPISEVAETRDMPKEDLQTIYAKTYKAGDYHAYITLSGETRRVTFNLTTDSALFIAGPQLDLYKPIIHCLTKDGPWDAGVFELINVRRLSK